MKYRKYKYSVVLLCSLFLLTGCSMEENIGNENENNSQFTDTESAELLPTETEKAAETFTAEDALAMCDLYEKYKLGVGSLTRYAQACTASALYQALQKVDEDYHSDIETIDNTYQEVYKKCSRTATPNIIPGESAHSADTYDPVSAVFYRHMTEMEVNPIELMTLLTENSNLFYIRKSITYHNEPEWHDFTYSYPVTDVAVTYNSTTYEEYLSELLSNYTNIPAEQLNIGYSETEQLYYCYFIDFENHDFSEVYPNLLLDALYFQFDESGKLSRCGAETYVRTTDSLKNSVFRSFSAIFSSIGCRSYYDEDEEKYCNLDSYITVSEDTIGSQLMPKTHKDNCSFFLSLLTDGDENVSCTSDNRAHFGYINDFHSAMNLCIHANAGHFVTWFTLSQT